MTRFSPSVAIADQQTANQIYDQVKDQVQGELQKRGYRLNVAPPVITYNNGQQGPYQGELPQDLTALTDEELGWYLGVMTEWIGFVSLDLAIADGCRNFYEAKLEFIDAALRIRNKTDENGKKRTEQERKDMGFVNPERVQINSQYLYWDSYATIVKAILKKAERNYEAVSRRITQRGQDIDRFHRTANASHGVQAPYFRRPGT